MSDESFIREVEEELRSDQLKNFWDRYKYFVIGGAIAIVVGTAGYRYWQYHTQSVAAASGDRFLEAVELSGDDKHDEAIAKLETLAKDGSGQYPALSKLRLAGELAAKGDAEKAIAAFDAIANDSGFDQTLRDIAKVRAGLLLVDHGTPDQVADRLEAMAGTGQHFRHSAREGMGLAAYKAKKYDDALKWFALIEQDNEAPQGVRQRVQIMLSLLAGMGFSSEQEN